MSKGAVLGPILVVSMALAGQTAQASSITYGAPYAGGLGYIPTFGEVFTVQPGNTVLDSFGFYLQISGTGTYAVSAHVYEWTGTAVTGGALYSANSSASSDGFVNFAPSLALSAGQTYIAMLSWSSGWAEGLACASTVNADCLVNPSPNTQFHYTTAVTEAGWQNGANWNGLVNGTWRVAFNLTLNDTPVSSVPENPGVSILLGVGLVVAADRRLRRPSRP